MKNARREAALTLFASVLGTAVVARPARAQAGAELDYPLTQSEIDNAVAPFNTVHPAGSFLRYGADPTGAMDSTAAINSALLCNSVAFDDYPGTALYKVTGPLRFRASGQILQGQGMGHTSSSARTTILYRGPAGGKVISISNGAVNWSECLIRDLLIDGNALAGIGIEGYDENIAGGCWRNRIENVAVINVTNGSWPTAIVLGNGREYGAPSFANDPIISGSYICNCARGLQGAGSLIQVHNTTFTGCMDAAAHAGAGSAWTFNGCVFSTNKRDFDGANIQQAAFSGCWFENSTAGIYRAAMAHSCSFTGCFLETGDPTLLMDFGGSAGYHFFGGNFLPTGTKSTLIANVNAGATGAVLGQGILLEQNSGIPMSLVLPPVQTGTASVRSVSGQLTNGQSLNLALGRGCFFVGANVWKTTAANVRTQASYNAFLFDGDNEAIVQIATRSGSAGGESFTLATATNGLRLTYKGNNTVMAFLSGSGVTG